MHPHHVGAALHRGRHRRRGAPDPLGRPRHPRDLADEALPARAHQPRQALQARPRPQLAHVPQDRQVLLPELGEAQARFLRDGRDEAVAREPHALVALAAGTAAAAAVVVQAAHRGGRAAHHFWVHGPCRDVIDDVRPGLDGCLGDGGAVGVDADEDVLCLGHRADEFHGGHDTGNFFLGRDFGTLGGCGLAAYIDHGGP
ncbi:hypothetical protein VP1G_10583 [Cytospora mali]|uniref:Uncharacterized protein n=1 Tax=Cytospora mali TaxID=578113 RepID=A0A194UPR4_CYTMA|nr:hypothetical protein VP1G_10583 [Valsa mali var. pyri (nom. inval.)]